MEIALLKSVLIVEESVLVSEEFNFLIKKNDVVILTTWILLYSIWIYNSIDPIEIFLYFIVLIDSIYSLLILFKKKKVT